MKTELIIGTENAIRRARQLILESRWFTVTPLPDDEYEFTRKQES